jgi:poly-gamma-glutamate synthesis protein (capsule biosynthesis protein)
VVVRPEGGLVVRRLLTPVVLFVLLVAGCSAPERVAWTLPDVTLTFGGDVHFQDRVDRLLADPATAFGPLRSELEAGDLTLVNLETPVTGRGEPEPKRYLFRAAPGAVPALTSAGVDAVALANNHSLDYGRVGLADTMAAAQRGGLGTVGAGQNVDQAFQPWRRTVRGVRVAVLAVSQVDDLAQQWAAGPETPGLAMAFQRDRLLAAVRAARADSDLVVVFAHWGVEGDRCPEPRQRDLARDLVDAGADVIVGAHAHVLQGAGRLGGAYVAYGLGNLLWYSSGIHQPDSARAGILHITVRNRKVIRTRFVPTVMTSTGQSAAATGWQAALARRNFSELGECSGLD